MESFFVIIVFFGILWIFTSIKNAIDRENFRESEQQIESMTKNLNYECELQSILDSRKRIAPKRVCSKCEFGIFHIIEEDEGAYFYCTSCKTREAIS